MGDSNSRLAYSTGGEAPPAEKVVEAATGTASRGARLRLERRASGRLMTLVSGLPGPRRELEKILRELKAGCGAGGTLKDGVVELQGDQRDKVEALLRARGLPFKRAGG